MAEQPVTLHDWLEHLGGQCPSDKPGMMHLPRDNRLGTYMDLLRRHGCEYERHACAIDRRFGHVWLPPSWSVRLNKEGIVVVVDDTDTERFLLNEDPTGPRFTCVLVACC